MSFRFIGIRTRTLRIRAISQVEMSIKIPCHQSLPIYQILAKKIQKLKALGMTYKDIAFKLAINQKTVAKGLRYACFFRVLQK